MVDLQKKWNIETCFLIMCISMLTINGRALFENWLGRLASCIICSYFFMILMHIFQYKYLLKSSNVKTILVFFQVIFLDNWFKCLSQCMVLKLSTWPSDWYVNIYIKLQRIFLVPKSWLSYCHCPEFEYLIKDSMNGAPATFAPQRLLQIYRSNR